MGRPAGGQNGRGESFGDVLHKEKLGDAYEIRKELERRLIERSRPLMERQYLERLLRQF